MTIETYEGEGVKWKPNVPRPLYGVYPNDIVSEEHKGPLILFSGGLDSTHLVFERLKTTNVHLLYVIGNTNPDKIKEELIAREKIKQWFADNPTSAFRILSDTIQRFETGDSERMFNDVRFSQPAMWMFPSLYLYKVNLHTSVEIAYVKDDLTLPYLRDLKHAWQHLTNFVKYKNIPLLFPTTEISKSEIYQKLPTTLRDLVWFCDNPLIDKDRNTVRCYRCGPCVRSKTYLNL